MFFRFGAPWFLLLLAVPIALAAMRLRHGRSFCNYLAFPASHIIGQALHRRFDLISRIVFWGKLAAVVVFIIALSQPRFGQGRTVVNAKGIDILICLDISGSMQTIDIADEDRLSIAKKEIETFVAGRRPDAIGLLIFAAKPFLMVPLTIDHSLLLEMLRDVDIGMIEDGTAIGSALAVAANRLKDSQAKSKVIILLTDGVNNTGQIDPKTAAELAKQLGIRVYTIGIGKEGIGLFPVQDPFLGRRFVKQRTEIDEKTLKEIADITGGRYFRIEDKNRFTEVFKEIDNLEKTKFSSEIYVRYNELFERFIVIGLGLLVVVMLIDELFFPAVL